MIKPNESNSISFNPSLIKNDLQLSAFLEFRETGNISLKYLIPLFLKAIFTDIPFAVFKYWPGPVGFKLRQLLYKRISHAFGKNVLIAHGIEIPYPKSITFSEYCFIDHHVTLDSIAGSITIGKRVHIAPYAMIIGIGGVEVGDYVGIGSFARIYSHSEAPIDGKRMSGPMIPESMKGMITAPVILKKDSLVGTGAVILPGVTLGEGAVVAANSLVLAHTILKPWCIYAGIPARLVGLRSRVKLDDL